MRADVSTDSDGDRTCGSCSSLISGNAYKKMIIYAIGKL